MNNRIVVLDFSTTCTGYAYFDIKTKALLNYGAIRSSTKGLSKVTYPEKPLMVMRDMVDKINELILNDLPLPKAIVVEEIAGSASRMSQKVLDMAHGILMDRFKDLQLIDLVDYYDVTGVNGWRKHLDMRLNDADKLANKEARKLNKTLAKGTTKLPIIGWKHLACRHANHRFGLNLDVEVDKYDGDRADAICIGDAYLNKRV